MVLEQHCEYISCHWIIHIKMITFMLCVFYHNKNVSKRIVSGFLLLLPVPSPPCSRQTSQKSCTYRLSPVATTPHSRLPSSLASGTMVSGSCPIRWLLHLSTYLALSHHLTTHTTDADSTHTPFPFEVSCSLWRLFCSWCSSLDVGNFQTDNSMLTLSKVSFLNRRDGPEPSNYGLMAVNVARPGDRDSCPGRHPMQNIYSWESKGNLHMSPIAPYLSPSIFFSCRR